MRKLLLLAMLIGCGTQAQVMVNGNDVNSSSQMEVWAVKKPFSDKESFFIDYGQDKFRPHYYDHKTQAILDNEGKKFEKGEWMKLSNYLEVQGWEMKSERSASIGEQQGRIITYVRKE